MLFAGIAACERAFYEERVAKYPHSFQNLAILASLYVSEARLSGQGSDFDRAESYAKKSLKEFSGGNAAARVVLAQLAQARHRFTQSIEIARESLKREQSLGAILAIGDLVRAAEEADTLVNLRPSLSHYSLRGLALATQGIVENAEYDFQNGFAVQGLGDNQAAAWERAIYARFLLKQGKLDEAGKQLEMALAARPQFHLAMDLKGELEARIGHDEAAKNFFSEAFSNSKQIPYLVHLGRVKAHEGKPEVAQQIFQHAEKIMRGELAQNVYGHRVEFAKLLLERKTDAANKEALMLVGEEAKNRQNCGTLTFFSCALLAVRKIPEDQAQIQAVLRTGYRDADVYQQAGDVEKALGNIRRSNFYYDRALQTDSKFHAHF